ncbi:transposase family protein [Streptomyces sp. CB01373]|uniref:transposase family protein n=1 Tax=Streptomyces sp. CB01373 TaxID=2020325 RepID=UPI001F2D4211|nr:transposase family protein [Streptomyces sp. CB01373]
MPGKVPGLLQRLAEVPDPRDPRGVRHALTAVLALTACAVPAGATSLSAVGEWIVDTPPQSLPSLRVATRAKGRQIHLLAALDHAPVPGKSNERTETSRKGEVTLDR